MGFQFIRFVTVVSLSDLTKAKEEGKYAGRPPMADEKVKAIKNAKAAGKSPTLIAKEFGLARSTVYRVLAM